MADKMAAKTNQNDSTNVSINDVIHNISVKNPKKCIDIDFVKETSTDELVNRNQEMVADLQTFIAELTDFKKHVSQALASSNKANQCNDCRDKKHLHNIISSLQV